MRQRQRYSSRSNGRGSDVVHVIELELTAGQYNLYLIGNDDGARALCAYARPLVAFVGFAAPFPQAVQDHVCARCSAFGV